MRTWGLVLAVTITGCIIEPPDVEHTPPDAGGVRDAGVDAGVDGGGYVYWDGGYVYRDGGYIYWGGGYVRWWDGGYIDSNGEYVYLDGGIGGGGGGGDGDGTGSDGGSGSDGGTGSDGGSDGGQDGGTPGAFPGSGLNGDSGTGVLWLVRIDRGTANLAASYAALIRGMSAQLAAEGFDVRMTGVASLYESRLYWSRSGSELPAAELQSMLESAAASASGAAPTTCSTAALSYVGGRLSSMAVMPPNYSSPTSSTPFNSPLSALLVVMLDHGARPSAYGASDCGTSYMDPAGWFGGSRSPTFWLNTASRSWNLPRAQTRFLFVATSENESYEQMRTRCAAMSTFPRTALDAISPSSIVFYAPFTIGLENYQRGLGTQEDLCRAVAGDWAGFSRGIAKDWASLLRLPENQR